MAMRNELDYFAVFFRRFDDILSFTVTKACHGLCANVKTLSIFSILLLLFLMVVALSYVQEKPTLPEEESQRNELGYFTIFFRRFDDMLSFTEIKACHGLCTNVKTLSIFSILLLLFLMAVALSCVQDKLALPEKESHERKKEDDRWQVVKCFWKNFGP
ncbi:hypothetical protein AHAS_Ahas04G0185900 [Arachis hypogaea]